MGLQSLQVQVYPCSIPGTLRRNYLFYSTNRTSVTQTELGWLASTAWSCLLGHGRVGSCASQLITKANIQAQLQTSSKHFSIKWQNRNCLVIARVSYFLVLWFHQIFVDNCSWSAKILCVSVLCLSPLLQKWPMRSRLYIGATGQFLTHSAQAESANHGETSTSSQI